MKLPDPTKTPEFINDLRNATKLTTLNGVIFPVLTLSKFKVKTASYGVNSVMDKPITQEYAGESFSADVNTYMHSNGSSICFVENIEWKNKPSWLNSDLVHDILTDANSRGYRMKESYCPIFMIVAARKTTLWGKHRDGELHRVHHVLISGDSRIIFYDGDRIAEEVQYTAGQSYLFDVSRQHNVVAYDNNLRINIVIDCIKA